MDKIKFIVVYGSGEYVSVATHKLSIAVNEKLAEGYIPHGSLTYTTEKRPSDSDRQHFFIQPMIFAADI